MKKTDISELLEHVDDYVPEVMRRLARIHIRGLRGSNSPIKNGPERRNRTTEDDVAADKYLKDALIKNFPDIGFTSEELSPSFNPKLSTQWIIDPIDGTLNYSQHFPHYATSIALMHNNDIIYGCIFDPTTDETFRCKKGFGVFLHGNKLPKISFQKTNEVLVSAGSGYDDIKANLTLRTITRLQKYVLGVRLTGCASLDLAYVAASRTACFLHPFLKIWDHSAGVLMVKEAGGTIIEVKGLNTESTKCYIAGEPKTANFVLKILEEELAKI